MVSKFLFLKAWTLHSDCKKLLLIVRSKECQVILLWFLGKTVNVEERSEDLESLLFGNVTKNTLMDEAKLRRNQEYSLGANGDFNRLEKEAHDTLSLALEIE